MIARLLAWLGAGGVERLLDRLAEARTRAQSAVTEQARIAAEREAAELQAQIEAHRTSASTRAAMRGAWAWEFPTLIAGLAASAHFAAVALDSALPGLFPAWTVHALPAPLDEWQGAIILSLFGATALGRLRR